jgi:hypothetical protein
MTEKTELRQAIDDAIKRVDDRIRNKRDSKEQLDSADSREGSEDAAQALARDRGE